MKRNARTLLLISLTVLTALSCGVFNDLLSSGGDAPAVDSNIIFQDDFSDPESGWDRFTDSSSSTEYENGAYRIAIFLDVYLAWATPYQDFSHDVIIDVDVTKVSGDDENEMGIICRHLDEENFYVLVIGTDGLAAIRKRYQGADLEAISDGWVEGASINTGNASNHLRAECIGDRLSLFVNGQLVVEARDSDIFSGDAGILAGTFEHPSLEVLFDNFVVSTP
jgi:hypothetical protein